VNDWTEDELKLCWCVATDSSPDDAPKPFPAGVAYKAVDAMQDREYAAEARALKAEAERDYYAKELDKATGMVEMHVDDAAAARLLWRGAWTACAQRHAERDAAIRERDEALAILRAFISADDGADSYRVLRISDAMDRARKLVGGGK
jgi:hypothetical protein